MLLAASLLTRSPSVKNSLEYVPHASNSKNPATLSKHFKMIFQVVCWYALRSVSLLILNVSFVSNNSDTDRSSAGKQVTETFRRRLVSDVSGKNLSEPCKCSLQNLRYEGYA